MNGEHGDEVPGIAGIAIRRAERGDLVGTMNVLDTALLAIGAPTVRERIEAGTVFVAIENGRVRGALVLSEALGEGSDVEIEAVAVRRRYRRRGIASALVERARRESERALIAEFDGRVRPFYETLGFQVRPTDDGRFRGHSANDRSE